MKRLRINIDKCRIACARLCINQKELAELAGVPKSTIGNAFKRQGASPATIGKIAKALGVDVLEIIEQEE
ncbi:MAG: helix-turn-helix transcriptional regulator [Butyricicoccus porcorum]|nr:helix-turn-helix transcriptional regulator [Butyricicoccus porcorum]